MNKKLLVIGYVWPEPDSSAAGSRMLELLEFFLAENYAITFASAATLSEHRKELGQLGITEQQVLLNCSSFDIYVQELQPDVVLFDRFFTEEQFGWRVEKACPSAIRILDTEDLHSLRSARQKILKSQQKLCVNEKERQSVAPVSAGANVLYLQMCNDDMAQREIAAIFRCDLSLMISEFEVDFLGSFFSVPAQLLLYCPFLKYQYCPDTSPAFIERQHFITIGNFRHEPNWDAVLWLKHQLWPLIRAQLPQTELHIYGAYPPPKATQLHNSKDGFLVKGWATNASQVMQSARLCLAPLRFGAGIKGKLMDAMQCGTPSVTTTIGAEAMSGGLPWGGLITDNAEEFSTACVTLYQDAQLWNEKQQQGFTILRDHFMAENYSVKLMERLNVLIENRISERNANFIGHMLRHHQHKSTQYMGQWIEAKTLKPINATK